MEKKKKGSDPGSNPGGAIFIEMLEESKKEGKKLRKSLLEKFLEENGEEQVVHQGFNLVRNSLIYEGREHDNYEIIIEKGGEYFRFCYVVTPFNQKGYLGKFRVRDKNDLGEKYFCEKVHPVKRTIIDYE